jgi:tight adherence protein C
MTTVVSHSERLGSNVGTALQEYADGMRTTQRQRAEERGNRRSVQMMFPIAICLAPPVYILLLAPGILEMYDFVIRENQPGGVLSQRAAATAALAPSQAGGAGGQTTGTP